MHEAGDIDFQPDVVCYNNLINAYGWSKETGRASKCFEIFQNMVDCFESKKNVCAKPDIVTCNSVLNAIAFEDSTNESEGADFMDMTIKTFEFFQSRAPKFGKTNHVTYANVLNCINKHASCDKRSQLAETTFWQCCQCGYVSVLVITNLYRVLPWDKFADLMGPALLSAEGDNLNFKWDWLPQDWTRLAPKPKERRNSRPSKKTPVAQVSKQVQRDSKPPRGRR